MARWFYIPLFTALIYCVFFQLNNFLFGWLEFSSGVNWVFLPSGSGDAALRGAPTGHTLTIREVRLAAGAEFIVVVCGDIMTMPGLPKVPAANGIDFDEAGRIKGLF